MVKKNTICIGTINTGGARRDRGGIVDPVKIASDIGSLLQTNDIAPDILALQESIQTWAVQTGLISTSKELANNLENQSCHFENYFFQTLDSQMHSHINKWNSLFSGYTRVTQGNAIIANRPIAPWPWPLPSTGNPGAKNLTPIFTQISSPTLFSTGNRNTEPRNLIITPFQIAQNQIIYFIATHLSTISEEKRNNAENPQTQKASKIRTEQIQGILTVVNELREAERINEVGPYPIIIAGDFNAKGASKELMLLTESNFERCMPRWFDGSDDEIYTHLGKKIHIDHIFINDPNNRICLDECFVLKLEKKIIDHCPVIAHFSFAS